MQTTHPNHTPPATAPKCECCEADLSRPITVFRPYLGGWAQQVVYVCDLCTAEIERGSHPIYKPTRNLAA